MVFAFPPRDVDVMTKAIRKSKRDVETQLPTRLLFLLPAVDSVLRELDRGSQAEVVLDFEAGSLPLVDPSAFRVEYSQVRMLRCKERMLLVQVQNAEAAAMYPVDSESLFSRISRWRNRWRIGSCVRQKWLSSVLPSKNLCEVRATTAEEVSKEGHLNFFDAVPSLIRGHRRPESHPVPEIQRQWEECDRYNKYLGSLGILPDALKEMVRSTQNKKDGGTDHRACQETISLISRKLCCTAYQI